MDFLGIGIPELLFFIVIMLLVLGPTDMAKLGHSLGTNLRKLWKSPTWRMIFSTSNTLRNLPNALAREAGMEEIREELRRETQTIKNLGKDVTEEVQANAIRQSLALKTGQQVAKKGPVAKSNDFAAWTTPPSNDTQSIAPPGLSPKTTPSEEKSAESSATAKSPSES